MSKSEKSQRSGGMGDPVTKGTGVWGNSSDVKDNKRHLSAVRPGNPKGERLENKGIRNGGASFTPEDLKSGELTGTQDGRTHNALPE